MDPLNERLDSLEVFEEQNPARPAHTESDFANDEHVLGEPPLGVEKEEFKCSRGFTEKDWSEAYARWKHLAGYTTDSDDEEYVPKAKKGRPLLENGDLSIADAMDLDYSHPDELPDYFRNILAKYSHAGKQKRRSYSFGQKLAIIKWINFQYASSPAPNISEAAKKKLG